MTKHPRSDASFTPRFPAVWAVATYALCAFSLAWPALLGRTLVADAKPGDAGPDRHDLAGDFVADDGRELRRNAPGLDVLDGQARCNLPYLSH